MLPDQEFITNMSGMITTGILSPYHRRIPEQLINCTVKKWFPQVMIEKHQMGATDVRYFAPPPHDPIAENVNEAIWNWMRVFGSAMAKDMTAAGLAGVTQQYLFDDYWPGSTETAIWKNVIGMLTECASANVASPLWIEKMKCGLTAKVWENIRKVSI